MNHEENWFGLHCKDRHAPRPVLTNVQAAGRLDGVLFELTLRQTYRNTSHKVLEVVYTFPLPHQAVLLGFATELNGARLEGAVVARRAAERQYEEAMVEGDAPVLLEVSRGGLHTANIGNLMPGDSIVLEVRFAQVPRFEQGRVRLAIPTTIAPRFGNALTAGLQPQQVPESSMTAEYPLALSLVVSGALATAALECPTHSTRYTTSDGCSRLDLAPGARLDRDVVIIVTPRDARQSIAVRTHDRTSTAAPIVVMAAFQPSAPPPRARIGLKLLVDCSGSMAGDSIRSARAALHGILDDLQEDDVLTLTRFGAGFEHLQGATLATGRALRHLGPRLDALEADMGGTDIAGSLEAVFALPMPEGPDEIDVLIITDGQIWNTQPLVESARRRGHRVFAIGVGASPAESLLRNLAEATGGACEFATPGEALGTAARRTLARIRQPRWRQARVDWGVEPAWQTELPNHVFGGDTVIAFAGMAEPPSASAPRLLALDGDNDARLLASATVEPSTTGDSLARIAAARRMATASDADALKLALDYQLLGKQTHCVLVHQRAEAEKAIELAELHRVSSMMAAGWSGSGSVLERMSAPMEMLSRLDVTTFREEIGTPIANSHAVEIWQRAKLVDDYSPPATVRRSERHMALDTGPSRHHDFSVYDVCGKLDDIRDAAVTFLSTVDRNTPPSGLAGLGSSCTRTPRHPAVARALALIRNAGISEELAWLLLAYWSGLRTDDFETSDAAVRMRLLLDSLDPELINSSFEVLDGCLGHFPNDSWTPTPAPTAAAVPGTT